MRYRVSFLRCGLLDTCHETKVRAVSSGELQPPARISWYFVYRNSAQFYCCGNRNNANPVETIFCLAEVDRTNLI